MAFPRKKKGRNRRLLEKTRLNPKILSDFVEFERLTLEDLSRERRPNREGWQEDILTKRITGVYTPLKN